MSTVNLQYFLNVAICIAVVYNAVKKEYTANMDAVIIRVIDLPPGVKGMTVKDEEGDYNIYLNGRLSNDQRVEAFRHELDHIKFGHFYSNSPVSVKERETNTRRK